MRPADRSAWALLGVVAASAVVAAACGRTPVSLGASSSGGADEGGSEGGSAGSGGDGGGPGPGGGGSGGQPEMCLVDQDCNDLDTCTTDRCDEGHCSFTERDDDDDGFTAELCGGADCNDLNPNAHPGLPEACSDGSDNDCNGVSDCFDPACTNVPDCGCVPSPTGESCLNGTDDDCDTTVDCNDPDCIGTIACGCAPDETDACDNGIDDDCDDAIDCDDNDCFSATICTCQTTQEFCSNDADEDCDLLIDCTDPDCFAAPACSCIPPGTPEICTDNFDNDCDELVDCADGNCAGHSSCAMCMPEICDDGEDNDCDDIIDCADDACFFSPSCPTQPEICNNSLDDDHDGLTDCLDPDCSNNPLCASQHANCLTAMTIPAVDGTYFGDTTGFVNEYMGACGGGAGEAVFRLIINTPSFVHLDTIGTSFDSTLHVRYGACEAGAEIACDDDSGDFQWSAKIEFPILYPGTYYIFVDGFTVDPNFGANEGPYTFNVEVIENPPENCADAADNDGDIYVDCADSDCAFFGACQACQNGNPAAPEFGTAACTDGVDNDCDGLMDCADSDCHASPYAVTECCDGADENDNGIVDDFSCRCSSDADCDMGQLCYTHTIHTCGFPCQAFFGMVCPAVAEGSFCSMATQQCEF